MGIKRVSTNEMSHDDWVELRKKSIGGSDAAAIVGLNNYSSAFSVWAEKTGRIDTKEDNEAMRQGRDLEEYVAQRFMEQTGKKVRKCNAVLYNDLYPFAHANIDREVIGEDAGLECKTTSLLNPYNFKNGEYPENYYVQSQHYMAITGKKKWYIAVLVLNRSFHVYEVDRDEDEIAALMNAEADFWRCVEEDTPPAVDGSEATTDAIKVVYNDCLPEGSIDMFTQEGTLERINELGEAIKRLQNEKTACENEIKTFMGENELGICGLYRASWKQQERSTFDFEKFRMDHPELNLDEYYKKTKTRVFRISKKKGEK